METSLLPRISLSELQRRPRSVLDGVQDYAVIQSHSTDLAFVLHPSLGKILLESGMLQILRDKRGSVSAEPREMEKELTDLIGNVLRELSKK